MLLPAPIREASVAVERKRNERISFGLGRRVSAADADSAEPAVAAGRTAGFISYGWNKARAEPQTSIAKIRGEEKTISEKSASIRKPDRRRMARDPRTVASIASGAVTSVDGEVKTAKVAARILHVRCARRRKILGRERQVTTIPCLLRTECILWRWIKTVKFTWRGSTSEI